MAKHSEDKIKLIQLDYENGKSISELSLLYGVSQGTIKYWYKKGRSIRIRIETIRIVVICSISIDIKKEDPLE